MKYAFDNANLIDGTQDMRVQPGLCVLTDGETITDIVPAVTAPAAMEVFSAMSPASRPITSTTLQRAWLSPVSRSLSTSSTTVFIAVSKPMVISVEAMSLSIVPGMPMQGMPASVRSTAPRKVPSPPMATMPSMPF